MTLPKNNRMTSADFRKRFRGGSRLRGTYCSIQFGPLDEEQSRVSIVVQIKAAPKAVTRNRIRRVLSELVTQHLSSFSQNIFLAIIVHAKITEATLPKCQDELIKMLQKSGIIK